jgi:hypothetical protein
LGQGQKLNSDISRSLGTERLCLRGALTDDASAMNAAVIESWVELSRWVEWAQGAKPTIQDTIEQINKRESDFENRFEFRFSIFEKRAGIFS